MLPTGTEYFRLSNTTGFTFDQLNKMNSELRYLMSDVDKGDPFYDEFENNEAVMIMKRYAGVSKKRRYDTDYRRKK